MCHFCILYINGLLICVQVRTKEEKKMWGWSPLYCILKQHLVALGPQCPWYHTKQELQDILVKLEKETKPFSLECECRHIV
jgi:hypothetical protein